MDSPESTYVPIEEVSSPTLERQALDLANKFLDSPEAKTVKEQEFISKMDQRLVKLASPDTLFHVESGHAAGSSNPDSKKTTISWLTLGEDKGDLPGGGIEILEDGGVVSIFAYKLDKPLITDEGYKKGYSVDVVDRTNEMSVRGQQVELSQEQTKEILRRLGSAEVDSESTETTARILDVQNRLTEAIVNIQNVQKSNPIERRLKMREALKRLKKASEAHEEFWPPLPEEGKKVEEDAQENEGMSPE